MEICYLLAFPETADGGAPPPEQFKGLIKDAPYFQPVDIDLVTLGEETIVIEGCAVAVMRHRYDEMPLRPSRSFRGFSIADAHQNSKRLAESLHSRIFSPQWVI
jgi:hypothetical protein